MPARLDAHQPVLGEKAQRPVATAHRRMEQVVDQLMQRRIAVRFLEEKADSAQVCLGDGIVITLRVVVDPADTLVEAADELRKFGVEVDL